ncbi:MAG: hypothetical protein WC924_02605 [Candidatus Gracilibacteria bacterium]
MKILIFTEGTLIMHRSADSIYDYADYVPIKNAVEKLRSWRGQGAEIVYLTSRTVPNEVEDIRGVLKRYDFPGGEVFSRTKDEGYHDIVERMIPDVLIEDDCESIGGLNEMTITHVNPSIKERIKSIPVKEFGGIGYLPNSLEGLSHYH